MNGEASRKLRMLLFVFLSYLVSVALAAASDTDCIVRDSSGTIQYDLRPLGYHGRHYIVDGHDSGYTFEMNICSNLAEPSAKSTTLLWKHAGQNGTLGIMDNRLQQRGDKLALESISGDVCSETSHIKRLMLVSFICEPNMEDNGQPVFVSEWAGCVFMFEWKTPAACRRHISTGKSLIPANERNTASEVSRGAVIFVAVFVVGSIYLLGGFLYNRVLNMSSGLRGMEQFPNYRLWHSIYLGCKRVITRAGTGILYITDTIHGRRGAIRIDDAEHNIRGELFGTDDDDQDMLPISQR
ncbi:mannose 6-phosphate receptor domain-containing protein [Coemansia reversa NRRL 1564]|uniref:Mannose 6-phosphate receptor domain-containing protein n=1 Tax=Coemansia reversa (strain ATCC 12441 / NRRL 1564) TaxID=763665 RepID=A0A2G5BDA5_COERN|nr:mannose 6-phosphate receptor domain-containing protein [Coemansia reversa NRRL 1564]|eukprot:PIA16998.1 mannose 6-phosphate receptor domain-containing protein [Coemansia reversa NRRL 1564]